MGTLGGGYDWNPLSVGMIAAFFGLTVAFFGLAGTIVWSDSKTWSECCTLFVGLVLVVVAHGGTVVVVVVVAASGGSHRRWCCQHRGRFRRRRRRCCGDVSLWLMLFPVVVVMM